MCSKVRNIYILIRPKKSINVTERINALNKTPVFEKIKEKSASFYNAAFNNFDSKEKGYFY
jgi:hypothetical protein